MPVQIREPEYLEAKILDHDHPLREIQKTRLSSFLLMYQEAAVAYYASVERYGDLRTTQVVTEPDDYDRGTDADRRKWQDAARQQVLWTHLTMLNGELLRRIYFGRTYVIDLLEKFKENVTNEIAYDASLKPTEEELAEEQRTAEEYPNVPGSDREDTD